MSELHNQLSEKHSFFYIVVFMTLLIKNNGQILEIINNV